MGLVVLLAKSFKPSGPEELDEFIHVGSIGLLGAIRDFDPAKGCKLSTWAWKHIRWAIMKHISFMQKHSHSQLPYDVMEQKSQSVIWELLPPTLSDKERQTILLRLQGCTFEEVGQRLGGYTRGWANKLCKSATDKIREANE